MRDRMLSSFTRAFKRPTRTDIQNGELHDAVLELALSFQLNYSLTFPPLNDTVGLVHYTRMLALPSRCTRMSPLQGQHH